MQTNESSQNYTYVLCCWKYDGDRNHPRYSEVWILCKLEELQIKVSGNLRLNLSFMVEQFQILLFLWPQTSSFWTRLYCVQGTCEQSSRPYFPHAASFSSWVQTLFTNREAFIEKIATFYRGKLKKTPGYCFLKINSEEIWARSPPSSPLQLKGHGWIYGLRGIILARIYTWFPGVFTTDHES